MNRLASPWSLSLLALLLPLLWIWWRSARKPAVVRHADLSLFADAPTTLRVRLRHLPRLLRVAFLILAIVCLARPQGGLRSEEITTQGVDIVVVLDRSGSMRAQDLRPDRLASAKRTIEEFVEQRETDRIGLAVFAREAYTACPLTLDHQALLSFSSNVSHAQRDEDGTAIGLGLASAVNRLKQSEAESRVVILLTDGENNAGAIAPLTAAELASKIGITVYTIGVGTYGFAKIPYIDTFGRERVRVDEVRIDEETLQKIANATGGRYFRATDDSALRQIFEQIDKLETTETTSEVFVSWTDRFQALLLAAGLIFLFEVVFLRFFLGWLP